MTFPLFSFLLRRIGRQTPVDVPLQEGFDAWLATLCAAIFVGYLTVAVPLPVLSLFVRQELGLSDTLVGLAVGISFLSTVLTRGFAGGVADRRGPELAVKSGFVYAFIGGAIYLAAALMPAGPVARYLVLLCGRLVFGVGESLFVTGILTWGVALAGSNRSGKVMTWAGMALYGSLALGAPVGLAVWRLGGFAAVALSAALIPIVALAIVACAPPVPRTNGPHRSSFRSVLGKIWPLGLTLALQGAGFATIGAFATLYIKAEGWDHAGLALSAFGGAFVLARILFGSLPDKVGGLRIAVWFFAIEIAGQALLSIAQAPWMAFLGAGLTGFGCSLIFPALGRVVVGRVPQENRGTALGAFGAFQDVAYGATGPVTGILVSLCGYRSAFIFGFLAASAGFALAWRLRAREHNNPGTPEAAR